MKVGLRVLKKVIFVFFLIKKLYILIVCIVFLSEEMKIFLNFEYLEYDV